MREPDTPGTHGEDLTPQEMAVLKLVTDGASVRKVASELSISTETVHMHGDSIMRKLNVPRPFHTLSRWIRRKLKK